MCLDTLLESSFLALAILMWRVEDVDGIGQAVAVIVV